MPTAGRSRTSRRLVLVSGLLLLLAGALALGRGASLPRADCAFVNGAEPATRSPALASSITAFTPGMSRAAPTSIERITAAGCGQRTTRACRSPSSATSKV
jgi:hypothetical protein